MPSVAQVSYDADLSHLHARGSEPTERDPDAGGLLLVCEEPRRGEALIHALGRRGAVVRELADGTPPARHVLFWVQRPVRWDTLRAQLEATRQRRVAVICHPRQSAIIDDAAACGATVITFPDAETPLVDKVRGWLAEPAPGARFGRVVAPGEIAEHVGRALERRLGAGAPALRVTSTAKIAALADQLAARVLAAARVGERRPKPGWDSEPTPTLSPADAERLKELVAAVAPKDRTVRPPPLPARARRDEPSGPRPVTRSLRVARPVDPEHAETGKIGDFLRAPRPTPSNPLPSPRPPSRAIARPPTAHVEPDDALTSMEPPERQRARAAAHRPSWVAPPLAIIVVMCVMGAAGGFGAMLLFHDRLPADARATIAAWSDRWIGSDDLATAAARPEPTLTAIDASPTSPVRAPTIASPNDPERGTVQRDDTAHDDTAHDDTAHDDFAHDDTTLDDTARDDTAHDDTAHDDTAHETARNPSASARTDLARDDTAPLGRSPLDPMAATAPDPREGAVNRPSRDRVPASGRAESRRALRIERGRRALALAQHHRDAGHPELALDYARRAARFAPHDPAARALVAQLAAVQPEGDDGPLEADEPVEPTEDDEAADYGWEEVDEES
ncbi:MAG: hypothetical protein AB7S26_01455 [Sandaracinaceae bacterium]